MVDTNALEMELSNFDLVNEDSFITDVVVAMGSDTLVEVIVPGALFVEVNSSVVVGIGDGASVLDETVVSGDGKTGVIDFTEDARTAELVKLTILLSRTAGEEVGASLCGLALLVPLVPAVTLKLDPASASWN